MLATEASLKAEVESLKEKLDSAVEDRSLMKKAMLVGRARAFEELAGMGLDFQLKDMKDYEPDAMDSFDKAVDNFYRMEFPYLDLLAYHARKSLGLYKSLDPPSLPPRVPSSKVLVPRLPTRANLDYRGIDLDSVRFPMYDDAIETEDHLFVSCSIAKDTWKCIADSWNIPSITIANLEGLNLADRVPLLAASIRFFDVVVQTTYWLLWRFRNDTTFATKRPNNQLIIDDVKLSSFTWISSRQKGFY
ncbi:RNA-directed DNA polymerase, eukaryota, reverse transcriptase zinc-binding domain protein [Tanacetum coccineum]